MGMNRQCPDCKAFCDCEAEATPIGEKLKPGDLLRLWTSSTEEAKREVWRQFAGLDLQASPASLTMPDQTFVADRNWQPPSGAVAVEVSTVGSLPKASVAPGGDVTGADAERLRNLAKSLASKLPFTAPELLREKIEGYLWTAYETGAATAYANAAALSVCPAPESQEKKT